MSQSENSPSSYHSAKSADELTQRNIQTIIQLEDAARHDATRAEKIIEIITKFFGRVEIIYLHVFWFTAWIVVNTALPKKWHFDPYPFEFLVLTLSLEAIFLSIFVLISQNRQGHLDERRNHLQMQIDLLTEQENTKTLWMLERIADKIGADITGDPDLHVLEEATRPERLIEQIDSSLKENR